MNQVILSMILLTDLLFISVSNDGEPNSSWITSLEDETKFNPPTKKKKSSSISNQQA